MKDATVTVPVLADRLGLDPPGNGRAGAERLGKVAAPPNKESTSEFFYFWVERDRLVERTQIVTTSSMLGGRTVKFVGLVEEVFRQSRQKDMGEEVAGAHERRLTQLHEQPNGPSVPTTIDLRRSTS